MAHEDPHRQAGTVRPARTRKAGCGLRYEADELRETIDFSGARQWLQENTPEPPEGEGSASGRAKE